MYVAMTRARHTLAISAIEPHRGNDNSWWQRLQGLATPQVLAPPCDATAGTPAAELAFGLLELPAAPATGVQGADATVAQEQDAASQAARTGSAAHRLLQWASTSEHHQQLAAREFALEPQQTGQAASMARNILQGAGAWAWDAGVLAWQANEVELVYNGKALRLDRLVQRADTGQWWVLDYKSAYSPGQQPQALAQMREYCEAVRTVYAVDVVRAAFLTAQGDLVLVV